LVDKPEIHAKSILIDEKYLYIWSVNFSSYSMDQNREIWLILKNEDIIRQFITIFNNDFQK
jgi:phosphatidylserine/phosphatidylglycerophosphate/cardiolipin synthase-like enzyme